MKPMLTQQRMSGGFALPTIIIASVVLLTVLVTAVTAVGSITSSLASQYYNQLAREAAESGLANARACLRSNNYTALWTDLAPLKPDTDCTGTVSGSLSKWVVNGNNIRTSFSVPAPQVGAAGSLRVAATGTVELVRASDQNQVWRTYSYVAAQNSRYNDTPQIASGAGWKTVGTPGYSGHNGYMLASTGTLYGWGDNAGNQLGDNSLGTTVSTPVKITLPDGVNRAKKVFNSGQGASILCIIATHTTLGDQMYCRGIGGLGGSTWQRFGLSGSLTAVDAAINGYGADSACVIASDGQAYCAGMNDSGGLGNGTTSDAIIPASAPTKFRLDLASPGPISGSAASLTAKKIFNQDRFTCVIASDNQAYCAGDNNYGQLGQGTFATNVWVGKSIPGRAIVPGAPAIVDIRLPYHGGYDGVFYQTVNGDVFVSGHSAQGTTSDGYIAPGTGNCAVDSNVNCYPIPEPLTIGIYSKMISVGERGDEAHSFCVIEANPAGNSGLSCLGANTYGQTGDGTCNNVRSIWNSPVSMGSVVVKPTLNDEASYQMNAVMVITTAGDVYAAGDNTYGKLGTGGPLQACNATFAKVQMPVGVKAVALANTDEYTSFILGDNGKVYAMGRNNNGQLGDGTTTNRSVPVEVQIPRQETVY